MDLPYVSKFGNTWTCTCAQMLSIIWIIYLILFAEPFNIIDFVSTAPFWIDVVLKGVVKKLAVLRVLRLLRVFRVIRAAKAAVYVKILMATLKTSRDALLLLVFVVSVLTTLFGSIMFFAEQTGQKFNSTENTWYRFNGDKSPFQVSACLGKLMCG